MEARSEIRYEKCQFLVWTRIRNWRTGQHTSTRNCQEYPPRTSQKWSTTAPQHQRTYFYLSYVVFGWYLLRKDLWLRPRVACYWALMRAFEWLSLAVQSWITSFISDPFIGHLFVRVQLIPNLMQTGRYTCSTCLASNPLNPWGEEGTEQSFLLGSALGTKPLPLLYTFYNFPLTDGTPFTYLV